MEWVENIAGKGENAGYQHFLIFPQCFQKAFCLGGLVKIGVVKIRDRGKRLNNPNEL